MEESTTMRVTYRIVLCLALVGAALASTGCTGGGRDPAPEPSSGAERPTSPTGGCGDHATCEPCLAAGCQWTGGTCASECLQDVSCFGSGNPAAAACPAEQPEESTDF
jgi:hypothetical protein